MGQCPYSTEDKVLTAQHSTAQHSTANNTSPLDALFINLKDLNRCFLTAVFFFLPVMMRLNGKKGDVIV